MDDKVKASVFIFLIGSTLSCAQDQVESITKYQPEALQKDFDLVWSALNEVCPVLYVYRNEEEVASHFAKAREQLRSPMFRHEYYMAMGEALAFVQDGHLRPYIGNDYHETIARKDVRLPLTLKFLNGSVYVLKSMTEEDRVKEGEEVIAINGKSVTDILADFSRFTSSDGDNINHKYRKMDVEFRGMLCYYFQIPEEYQVTVRSENSSEVRQVIIKGMSEEAITAAEIKKYGKRIEPKPYSIEYDNERSIAIFRFDTFGDQVGEKQLRKILNGLVERCNKQKITSLVLDIRSNTGGFDGNAAVVYSYLTNKPFEAVKGRYLKTLSISITEHLLNKDIARQVQTVPAYRSGNEYKLDMALDKVLQPNPVHFDGDVYLLLSNTTFSTAGLFANIFSNHSRGPIIGSSGAGGGYRGDSGGMAYLELPLTKMLIQIPLVRNEYILDEEKEWTTMEPDYRTRLTIQDILNNTDREMEKVYELINSKKK